jgi:hypothetical protein
MGASLSMCIDYLSIENHQGYTDIISINDSSTSKVFPAQTTNVP